MTKRNVIEMNLPTADDLFSTQEERDNEKREYVKAIPLDQISDFPNHPFKVRMDARNDRECTGIRRSVSGSRQTKGGWHL